MPFYDYKCSECGKTFEVIHGMNGKPEGLKCEFCGSADLQRVFHPVGTMKASSAYSDAPTSSGSSCSSCSSSSCSTCR